MSRLVRYIVGNKFEGFAKANAEVITISNFEKSLDQPLIGNYHEIIFLIGQGVTLSKLERLIKKIYEKNLQSIIKIRNSNLIRFKESLKMVHKHDFRNIMISSPIHLGSNRYESIVLLDDECAEMSDHMTGQHIQGMVLIEASRQMMLAVTENYLFSPEEQYQYYFVLNKIDTQFMQFAFPLDIKIRCLVKDYTKGNNSLNALIEFEIIQNETVITRVNIDFSAYQSERLSKQEARMADRTIKSLSKINESSYTTTSSSEILPASTING